MVWHGLLFMILSHLAGSTVIFWSVANQYPPLAYTALNLFSFIFLIWLFIFTHPNRRRRQR